MRVLKQIDRARYTASRRGKREASMGIDLKPWVAGLCCALACTAPRAANEDRQVVEVTGSWLPALRGEGTSPIQVITREEIRRSGAGTIREVLDQVAAFTSPLSDLGGNGSFTFW